MVPQAPHMADVRVTDHSTGAWAEHFGGSGVTQSRRAAASRRLASTRGFKLEVARVESGHDTRISDLSEHRNTART